MGSTFVLLLFNSIFKLLYVFGTQGAANKMASSVDAKLLKSTKFPPEFSQKVDMKKVNVEVMKK